jgi:ribonuclease III
MTVEELDQFEQTLGHHFERPERLEQALTHRSARQSETAPPPDDNDRLEFLGDRVIGLVVSDFLLQNFPDWDAGKLSKAHSRLVSGASMRSAAESIGIGRHLVLGRGEELTGGREKQSLLADAYEAVVAAIYLDAGLPVAVNFVRRTLLEPAVTRAEGPLHVSDHKSALQEWVQQHALGRVEYRVWRESGPEHKKIFEVEAWLDGKRLSSSEGHNKKEAEQAAARKALEGLMAKVSSD